MLNFLAAIGSAPAGGGGSFESIATANGTGSSNTITFSSIPSTYRHLQLRCLSKTTETATAIQSLYLNFNNDSTSANYTWHRLEGNGASASASGDAGGYAYALLSNASSSSSASFNNNMGVSIIDIHDYASTTKNKTVRSFMGMNNNLASAIDKLSLESNLWINTAAINSIKITTSSGNFTTSSTFALYGIRGA